MGKKIDFKAEFEKQQRETGIDFTDPMNNLITKPKANDRLADFIPEPIPKRTKRVQLVMTPELYERAKKMADKAGISFNEFINQLCNKVTQ
jgi:predicted HicB family RNase H-like nuclease